MNYTILTLKGNSEHFIDLNMINDGLYMSAGPPILRTDRTIQEVIDKMLETNNMMKDYYFTKEAIERVKNFCELLEVSLIKGVIL